MEDNEKKVVEIKPDIEKVEVELNADNNSSSNKGDNSTKDTEPDKKITDSIFIYVVIGLFIVLAIVIFVPKFVTKNINTQPTLEELNTLNLNGKLSPDKGYMYNGVHSFVLSDGIWYTWLQSPSGNTIYSIPFHYGARETENISTIGAVNITLLNLQKNFFITTDPTVKEKFLVLSISEAYAIFLKTFDKNLTLACTNNDSVSCANKQVINCNSTSLPVIYLISQNSTYVKYDNNCITISGNAEELLRATDRMLLDFLGVIR
jgi:hypothetical protein